MARQLLIAVFALTLLTPARAVGEPWRALVSAGGEVRLSRSRTQLAAITPGLFEATWRGGSLVAAGEGSLGEGIRKGTIRAPGGVLVDAVLRCSARGGALALDYTLTPRRDVRLNSLHVAVDMPIRVVAGQPFVVDGEAGKVPVQFGNVHVWGSRPARRVEVGLAGGSALRIEFATPTPVLLQDNRQWGPSFTVRIGPQMDGTQPWPAGKPLRIAFTVSAKEGMEVQYDRPVTIEAGPDWVPLREELDIEPGSALDFSAIAPRDLPAGKWGHLIARPDGEFAFEKAPGVPRRFYGVNLCFSAQYITHEQADRLAERLMRIGYNAVRFHHYEGELVDLSSGSSTTLRRDKLDQLDYLCAALKKRGIYLTTDLFVSRPVLKGEIWPGETGRVGMNDFKMLVPVNERALENWKAFARNLLTHRNPYTGLTYAEDPAFAWLAMINEGNVGNYLGGISGRVEEDWKRAWNAFLARRYGSAQALEKAWGEAPGGDPLAGTVPLCKNIRDDSPRGRDCAVFVAEAERNMFLRMKHFLRDELGVKALLTNMNAWTNPVQMQAVRAEFDYVDDHFYVDHPQFIERSWRLPSRCPNASPVAGGATGGRHCAFVRVFGKPFTISEYNYAAPLQFRAVGGMITGALAASQDWDVLWRFAYSHNRGNLFDPRPVDYFNVVSDPLMLASERAALCLFLRGDMRPAPHSIAIAMSTEELLGGASTNHDVAPGWDALALVTRVGSLLTDRPPGRKPDIVLPLSSAEGSLHPFAAETGDELVREMSRRGWLKPDQVDLAAGRIRSETGELLLDAPRDVLVVNTPRTAGGFAPEGETIEAGPLRVSIEKSDATVWVSSLDGRPIAQSRRLLITHLTDLQNSGERFAELARQTLLAWGGMPHLVRAGSATLALEVTDASRAKVWALSMGGRRVADIPTTVSEGRLVVSLRVRGSEGARMLYEIGFE